MQYGKEIVRGQRGKRKINQKATAIIQGREDGGMELGWTLGGSENWFWV